jgi:hypothetical protein
MAPNIGLIVTGKEALQDFQIFVQTLEMWHKDATLFVYTDSETKLQRVKYKGTIHTREAMNQYVGKRRYEMESLPGIKYDSLFKDYTYEKANVLKWMLETLGSEQIQTEGIWFMDADIAHMAPLPSIPETATLALSPHYIRECDTKKYGYYNAGYLWLNNPKFLPLWTEAGFQSRFFEQAALEDIAEVAKQDGTLYEFPMQVNFGWWRMFQSPKNPVRIQEAFSIFRKEESVGIRYEGKALQSVHTHWNNQGEQALIVFNTWLREFLKKIPSHVPCQRFRSIVG